MQRISSMPSASAKPRYARVSDQAAPVHGMGLPASTSSPAGPARCFQCLRADCILLAACQVLDKAIAQTSLLQEELQPSDFPTSQGKAFYGAPMNTRAHQQQRTCLQLINQENG